MEIDNTFTVRAPIDEVWATLMDVDRVAGCVPGAKVLNQLSDDAYQVAMRVRLGPMTMSYRGQVEVTERDADARRAVMRGKAKEAGGQGTADATVELNLQEDGELTRGTVHADVRLSGKVAAMGKGVIGDVAAQLVEQFAGNLETLVTEPAVHERSGATVDEAIETASKGTLHGGVERQAEDAAPLDAPVEQVGGDAAMTGGQTAQGPGTAGAGTTDAGAAPSGPAAPAGVSGGRQSQQGARSSDRLAAGDERPTAPRAFDDEGASLDGLALAAGVLRSRLADPNVVLGLVAVVALVAYRLGRRGRRRPLGAAQLEQIESWLDRR
ncbi:MAG: SRPBCC family protein [Euzebyales bacterium]|nr:SRPBCC family protein [Euzebyales bacterium]